MQHLEDKVLNTINEQSDKDRARADQFANKIAELLQEELKNEDFNIKHGFLALARNMIYLAQSFCKDEEEFNEEMTKANSLAVDKMIFSLMPTMKDGIIIDENFDPNDLKVGRLMMSLGIAVDYIFWKSELGAYASKRLDQEIQEKIQEK